MILEQRLAFLELRVAVLDRRGDALELAIELLDLAPQLGEVPLDLVDLLPDLSEQLAHALVLGGDGGELGTGDVEGGAELRGLALER